MERIDLNHLDDDDLHTLVDQQGPPEHLAVLRVRLAGDTAAQARLAQWTAQRAALRALHADVLAEPVPQALVRATRPARWVGRDKSGWWRYGGLAASLLLTFAAGWLARTGSMGDQLAATIAWPTSAAQMTHDFVRQANLAHSVYVPEARHPVEVTAGEQVHLVQWLSKRLGRALKVPDFTAQGFDLVGGRLLPGDAGARAQFMYQNAAGTRVTLYLGGLPGAAERSRSAKTLADQNTAFRYESLAGVPSFYWVDQGFGYALSGQVPRDVLTALAQAAYRAQ